MGCVGSGMHSPDQDRRRPSRRSPYTLLVERCTNGLSGQLWRVASSRLSVPVALVSKSSNGIAAARSWLGWAAVCTIALGFSSASRASTPGRSRMSSSVCWKLSSCSSRRFWFQRVSPCGPGLIQSSAGVGSGRRRAIASSAVMSCITACKPVRIERNPARRKRFKAAVRSVAITPAPLPR